MKYHPFTVFEEHVVLVDEQGSKYLGILHQQVGNLLVWHSGSLHFWKSTQSVQTTLQQSGVTAPI